MWGVGGYVLSSGIPVLLEIDLEAIAANTRPNTNTKAYFSTCSPEFDSSAPQNSPILNEINRLATLFEIFVGARFKQ